jgi:WD40 repeat protein
MKILTYYSNKDDIYQTLMTMSRKSLFYLKKNFYKIEKDITLKHANERIKFIQVKSIEEHNSGIFKYIIYHLKFKFVGVNQMMRINDKELVTVSDDCTVKFWSSNTLKVEAQIMTETITCIAATGLNKNLLVAGCHSGNLILILASTKNKI